MRADHVPVVARGDGLSQLEDKKILSVPVAVQKLSSGHYSRQIYS